MTTIVYNSAQIKEWQTELPIKQSIIHEHSSIIQGLNQTLIPLQTQLQIVQGQISSVQSQITLAEMRNAQDANYHWHQSHHHNRHHYHSGTGFLHTIGDVLATINTVSLYSQLSSLNADRSRLEHEINPILQHVNSSRAIIQNAEARAQWLVHQIQAGTGFLHTLKNKPADLLNALKKRVANSFKRYDDDNPAGRSPQVRICLFAIQDKLDFFPSDPSLINSRNLQINYLRLCAFLEDMYRQVSSEGQDKGFNHILESLIENTHISLDGDLPDDMKTDFSKTQHFAQLQLEAAQLFAMSEQQLALTEQDIYTKKLQLIQARVVYDTLLQDKINSAVSLIHREVESKITRNEAVDYHFYNRALYDLHHLSIHSNDTNTIQHLAKLAESASGTPSTSKKVIGALIAVLGVLLIAASIACLIATACGSSFLSAAGVALGLSLIQSQIAVGVSLSVTAAVSGGLTFWGCTKFKEGMRQGVSKELIDVQEELLHPTTAPA